MTKKSGEAFTTTSANSRVFCGDSEPATGTPDARISAIRDSMSSGWIGAAYTSCMRFVADTWSSIAASSSKIGCGSAYRVHRPSRFSTPRPPS